MVVEVRAKCGVGGVLADVDALEVDENAQHAASIISRWLARA